MNSHNVHNLTQVVSGVSGNKEMQVTITKDNKSKDRERKKDKDRMLKNDIQELYGDYKDELMVPRDKKRDKERDKTDQGKSSKDF